MLVGPGFIAGDGAHWAASPASLARHARGVAPGGNAVAMESWSAKGLLAAQAVALAHANHSVLGLLRVGPGLGSLELGAADLSVKLGDHEADVDAHLVPAISRWW